MLKYVFKFAIYYEKTTIIFSPWYASKVKL